MFLRKALLTVALIIAGTPLVLGQNAPATLEMNADGEIQIAPDGQVSDYLLKSKLPQAVAALVNRDVRSWRFEPVLVDGQAVVAKTAMHIRLKAEAIADSKDNYKVRIADVRFGEPLRNARQKPPHYPQEAVSAHLGARVLLYVRLDEAGQVVEVQPYQTSLDARTRSEAEAERWRRTFEKASVAAAKNWHDDLSETVNGKPIDTTVIIPIEFAVHELGEPTKNAVWKAYVPGPVHPAPWLHQRQLADNQDLSTLQDDEALSLDSRFRLKDEVIGKIL